MKNPISHIIGDVALIIILIALLVFGVIKYIDYRFFLITKQLESSNITLVATDRALDNKLKDLANIVSITLTEEQSKNNTLKDTLNGITDTVATLEKLSNTDPELLKKYSKVYFLNEHYVPLSLQTIDSEYLSKNASSKQISSDVWPFLRNLFQAATAAGFNLQAQSAYRSFGTQSALKTSYTFTYGAGTANRFSADQGYSEHQLGTTLDFTTANTGGLEGFDNTPEYKWLQDNAYKYGFILSYPTGNAYYKYEPWHWRFVGVALATKLHEDGMYFYDTDQRVIDTYLANLFD